MFQIRKFVAQYSAGLRVTRCELCDISVCVFQMRKFVAQYSAGLRVRLNPSLQSEQIGIVQPSGTISFIDEVRTKTMPSS